MKSLKHRLIFVICAGLIVSLCGHCYAQATGQIRYAEEEIQQKKVKKNQKQLECGTKKPIRVAGFVTNPPFGWVDIIPGAGTVPDKYLNDGFAYALFEKMAADLNLSIQNVGFKSYYEAHTALRNGKIDVLLSSYYDKRTLGAGTSLLFPGYINNPIIVAFSKGRERPVLSLEDLKGLKGIIRQEENIYSLIYQQIPETVKIEQIPGARKAYTMLMNGQADFMITSLYAAEAEMRRFKIADKITLTRQPLLSPELFFVFGSQSACLPLKQQFTDQLKKELAQPNTINALLYRQIDKWIERFRYADPLTYETPQNNDAYPSEIVENTAPTPAQ
ncbi:MAG: substrate-binding periplasmic protein [Alphaproteobacteria bacterium]